MCSVKPISRYHGKEQRNAMRLVVVSKKRLYCRGERAGTLFYCLYHFLPSILDFERHQIFMMEF